MQWPPPCAMLLGRHALDSYPGVIDLGQANAIQAAPPPVAGVQIRDAARGSAGAETDPAKDPMAVAMTKVRQAHVNLNNLKLKCLEAWRGATEDSILKGNRISQIKLGNTVSLVTN